MSPIVRTGFPMAALIAVTATPPKDGVTVPVKKANQYE